MSALIMFRIRVNDPALLKDYQAKIPPLVEKHKGKFLVRGGQVITLEGPEENRRIVVIEFPELEDAKRFYNSVEYNEAKKLRENISEFECIAVQGI
ncbi:MAG: DUF1330 domain-containing protein [Pseudomonadota bacterium]